jgi:crossover junction endodeoxyribonuclease RusA
MGVSFDVIGRPAPQGSKNQFGAESSQHVKPWRVDVKFAAQEAKPADWDCEGAVAVDVVFRFIQPKSHFTSKGKPSCNWTEFPVGRNKGDIDKLCRSTLDALTGVLFHDDAQVVSLKAQRQWSDTQGASISIQHL